MSCGNGMARLGAALRASGGGCAAAPPARMMVLADRVPGSRCAAGMTVFAEMRGVPPVDSLGRIAHVRGIYFDFNIDVAIPGATNDAITGFQMRGIIGSMFLEGADGHQYWSALDARSIMDDQWFRNYRRCQWPPVYTGSQSNTVASLSVNNGIAANNGVDASLLVKGSFYAPLTSQRSDASPLEGLIPLAVLQARQDALRFRVNSAFPGSPAGITFTELEKPDGTTGMNIWLDLVYLPVMVLDAPWQLAEYTLADQSGILRYPDRKTEYAAIRYFQEDTAGTAETDGWVLAGDHDGVTVRVAGFTVVGGYSTTEMQYRDLATVQTYCESSLVEVNAALDLPMTSKTNQNTPAPENMATMILLPCRPRNAVAAGPVSFEYATRTPDWTRYLHRTVACHTATRLERATQAVGCSPDSPMIPTDGTRPTSSLDKHAPVIIQPVGPQFARRIDPSHIPF